MCVVLNSSLFLFCFVLLDLGKVPHHDLPFLFPPFSKTPTPGGDLLAIAFSPSYCSAPHPVRAFVQPSMGYGVSFLLSPLLFIPEHPFITL
jgi:hypothetical protein